MDSFSIFSSSSAIASLQGSASSVDSQRGSHSAPVSVIIAIWAKGSIGSVVKRLDYSFCSTGGGSFVFCV
jgi:hypothetical protein